MKAPLALALGLATLAAGCGDGTDRPASRDTPRSLPTARPSPAPAPAPALPPRPVESLKRLDAAGRSPLELSAVAEQGHPPLPTYRATVCNVSDRPVRRAIVTVVYLDASGRALPAENQDVAFGSPLQAIEPGTTLETKFLSRVEGASEVRLVVRDVTFLEKGPGPGLIPLNWVNPRYAAELAQVEGRR